MIKLLTNFSVTLRVLTLISLFIFQNQILAQCNNFGTKFPSSTQSTISAEMEKVTGCSFAGDWARYQVTQGETYRWSTCGYTGFDTQLTLWNTSHSNSYAYNDNSCGLQSTITWTATFTGEVDVLVNKSNCSIENTCTTIKWACITCEGSECGNAISISSLPFNSSGNTSTYKNNHNSAEVPVNEPGAITKGDGGTTYINGNEVVYSYTPTCDKKINISITNDNTRVGLWAFKGCPFSSTVGYHTSSSGTNRDISNLFVKSGVTYYFVISTWSPPASIDYTINITDITGCINDPCESIVLMHCDVEYSANLTQYSSAWNTYTGVSSDYNGSEQVWSFTPPASGDYTFQLEGNSSDAEFFLMDGCSNTSTNLSNGSWSVGSDQTVSLTGGETYYLIADLYEDSPSTSVQVKVTGCCSSLISASADQTSVCADENVQLHSTLTMPTPLPSVIYKADNATDFSAWTSSYNSENQNAWNKNYTGSNAGGTAPELRYVGYSHNNVNGRLVSPAINANGYTNVELSFKQHINHYSIDYSYNIYVQVSSNSSGPWNTVYSITPGTEGVDSETQTVNLSPTYDGETFYIRFKVTGIDFGLISWSIDDIEVTGIDPTPITPTLTWSADSGPAPTPVNNSNPTATPSSTTTYYVSSTPFYGCTEIIDSVEIDVESQPEFTITSSDLEACHGNKITLEGSVSVPNSSDSWTLTLDNGGGAKSGTGSGTWKKDVTPTSTTTYSIGSTTVSSASCDASETGSTTVTLPNTQNTLATHGESATCNVKNGETVLFYNKTSGNYIASVTANSTDLENTKATVYVENSNPVYVDACNQSNYETAVMKRH